jgi:hypothetical protein
MKWVRWILTALTCVVLGFGIYELASVSEEKLLYLDTNWGYFLAVSYRYVLLGGLVLLALSILVWVLYIRAARKKRMADAQKATAVSAAPAGIPVQNVAAVVQQVNDTGADFPSQGAAGARKEAFPAAPSGNAAFAPVEQPTVGTIAPPIPEAPPEQTPQPPVPPNNDQKTEQSGGVSDKFCRSCGAPREPGARFCMRCGRPFEG